MVETPIDMQLKSTVGFVDKFIINYLLPQSGHVVFTGRMLFLRPHKVVKVECIECLLNLYLYH